LTSSVVVEDQAFNAWEQGAQAHLARTQHATLGWHPCRIATLLPAAVQQAAEAAVAALQKNVQAEVAIRHVPLDTLQVAPTPAL
jgi:hypothetical protein